jgi:alginate O-acetyltransferase complex protein AlgI
MSEGWERERRLARVQRPGRRGLQHRGRRLRLQIGPRNTVLFNSFAFLFGFLPVVFAVFFLVARRSHALASAWLALASLGFYGWWDSRYLLLLLGSIVFNHLAGQTIARALQRADRRSARTTLTMAVVANLSLLGYYKYASFFVDNLNALTGWQLQFATVVLPLGISFFTFTQIAFLVDTWQGKVKAYGLVHYTLFVTYFPHLIAGPILHHAEMMPQFARRAAFRINRHNIAAGVAIFAIGLAKKVLLADTLAAYATPVFSAAAGLGEPKLVEAWVGAIAYTLQLYFDFSGYCDMAIGISLMFNVRLPINFNSPYRSTSIIEFWRRWHMTLSRFLRDYLYIPLGGNRGGAYRRYLNLFVTMLLGGLWHGAAWNFVVWGALHGSYLMVNHGWRHLCERLDVRSGGRAAAFGAGALTFLAVVVGWVFFRADSVEAALRMLRGMAGLNGITLTDGLENGVVGRMLAPLGVQFHGAFTLTELSLGQVLPMMIAGLMIVFCLPNSGELLQRSGVVLDPVAPEPEGGAAAPASVAPRTRWLAWRPTVLQGVLFGVVVAVALKIMASAGKSEFLYFQF